jgi:parallel beta-helix repeat protein
MRANLGVIAAALLCVCSFGDTPVNATQYYVSTKGNDAHSGTSPAQAWLHFWQASKHLKPGDTVTVIADGVYSRSANPLNVVVSGRPGAWITVNAGGGRAKATGSATSPAIYIDADYVKVNGFDTTTGTGAKANAITVINSHHVVLSGSLAHDSGGGGINVFGSDYVQVLGNQTYRNAYANPNQPSGISFGYGRNFDTQPGVHNVVARNIAYQNMNKVATPAGYTTDGNGIIIDRMTEFGKYVGTTVVENNIAHSNGGRGIAVWMSDNVVVRNNTTYHNLTDPKMVKSYLGEIQIGRCNGCSVYNNIVAAGSANAYPILALRSTGTVVDYNITYGGKQPSIYPYASSVTMGAHNLKNTDPRFAAGTLYKLQSSSPALQAADPARAPATDILGTNRRPGQTDMGAYQQS